MENGSSNGGAADTGPSTSSTDSASDRTVGSNSTSGTNGGGTGPLLGGPLLGGPLLGGSLIGGDWPAQAADAIVTTVEKVRDRTTVPLMKLARATVYGVFIATVAITVLTLLVIGLVRLLDLVLPSGVWLAYLVLGVVTTAGGWLLYRKRNEPTAGASGKNSAR